MEISEHAKRAARIVAKQVCARYVTDYAKKQDCRANAGEDAGLVQEYAIDPAVAEYRVALKSCVDALGNAADLLADRKLGFGKENTPSYINARKLLEE